MSPIIGSDITISAGGGGGGGTNDHALLQHLDYVSSKHTGFAPSSHTHAISDVNNLETALSGKADTSHNHAMTDVTGLETALSGKADTSHNHAMTDVTGLDTALSGKANVSHVHAMSDVTGLDTALSGKANVSHVHAMSDVTGLDTALSGKANVSHSHAISDVTGLQTALDEKGTVGKVKLTANKTYYVRTDGNNNNSGEENTSGGAWATVGYACQWVAANVNLNGYTVTIQIGDGTYSGSINILADPIGPGWVIIQGNSSNYNAVVLDTTGTVQNTLYVKGAAKFIFRYLKIQCTASGGDRIGIYVDSLAYLRVTEVNMGSVVTAHFCASEGGQLLLYGNIGIGSGAGILFYSKYAGRIVCSGAAFTLTGTPNFSTATAYAIGMSMQLYYSTTFTGSATGKRYDGRTLSLIDTNGGGASYLPGNAAGTVVTGAVYN